MQNIRMMAHVNMEVASSVYNKEARSYDDSDINNHNEINEI